VTPTRTRRALLAVLAVAAVGTGLELILLDHTEDPWQWVPIVLTFASPLVIGWYLAAPHAVSRGLFRATMTLFVLSAVVGLVLHFRGNVEFALETDPKASGSTLAWSALKGAFPVLAPATMMLLGTLGWIASAIAEE
jgi:hypothetical protein